MGQWAPIVNLLDRHNSPGKGTGKAAKAARKGKETKAILHSIKKQYPTPVADRTSRVHPSTAATFSAQKININLGLRYNSDSDAEDHAKDAIEVYKPSSSSMGPPRKPASSMRPSSKPASSMGLPTIPSSSMGPHDKPAFSMGPLNLPASATRGMQKEVGGQGAPAEAPGQGK